MEPWLRGRPGRRVEIGRQVLQTPGVEQCRRLPDTRRTKTEGIYKNSSLQGLGGAESGATLRRRQGGKFWTREEMWAGLGRRLHGTRVQGQEGRQCEEVR